MNRHTFQSVFDRNGRCRVGVKQCTKSVWVKTQIVQFLLNLLQTFFQLSVGNRLIHPVGWKVYVVSLDVSASLPSRRLRNNRELGNVPMEGKPSENGTHLGWQESL